MAVDVIAVVGPTASGKTAISVELAKLLGGEIVSADSRLVYRDFNIGTAKPDKEEMGGVPHHMIDIIDPKVTYAAGKYKVDAEKVIEDILKRGKIPIVVGGTGFYVKALLEGLDIPDIEPDEDFRYEAKKYSKEELYQKLREIDPVTSDRLHINDVFRVTRALEVCHVTGKSFSELQKRSKPRYNVLYIGLTASEREFLYDRINRRVHVMIEQGLVDEVKSLILKHGRTVSLMKTLGYKEICEYLEGKYSLEEAIEQIQKYTRNFAKRQLTWFRGNKNILWFNIDEESQDQICKKIIEKYNELNG